MTALESLSTSRVASGSLDFTVKVWDLISGSLVFTFNRTNGGHTSGISCMAYSYDNNLLSSGSLDTTIKGYYYYY